MDIVFEDNHIIAINKPFGMLSQGDPTGDLDAFTLTKAYLIRQYKKTGEAYLALLHRIDRPVGGLLLMAKTSKAAARLSDDFQKKQIQKTYFAIVEQPPIETSNTLIHYLKKNSGANVVSAYNKPVAGAQIAELEYTTLQTIQGRALLKISPLTGRQHQIRVQLAKIGCVICGDAKYGKTEFLADRAIALFSQSIQFKHPTLKTEMTLSIPLPAKAPWQDFEIVLKK